MPDHKHRIPIPAVMNVGQFMARFGSHHACLEHLRMVRWGQNLEHFQCPECGYDRGWWLGKRQLVECRECHRQTSVTAGTVYRTNRRWLEASLFDRLIQAALDCKAVTNRELVAGVS